MWQLNYAFPYDSSIIIEQYKKYIAALSKSFSSIDNRSFKKDFKIYISERNKFRQLLKPADYRYFSFQVWQEGIARYSEYKFLQELDNYQPSKDIIQLPDFISFKEYKSEFIIREKNGLEKLKLNIDKRICFYAVGFAEGILLDKLNPEWHDRFLRDKFYIEKYFKK